MNKPDDANGTFIEPSGAREDGSQTFVEGAPAGTNAAPAEPSGTLTLNGRKYRIVGRVEKASTEADIFTVADEIGRKFILKSYRPGIVPKAEVIETLRSLSKKDVIGVTDAGAGPDGRFFEVQEFAEGGSLEEFMRKNRPLAEDFIVNAVAELNRCLNEIHSHKIVHRDVKPSNVLIRTLRPLDLVLTDFGISSIAETAMHQTSLNRTITYSSPESMTGVVSAASDYWALGMIALEMAVGKHPYEKMDEKAVMYSLVTRPVPFVETVGGRLSDLVRGLLTKDASKRWGYPEVCGWVAGRSGIPVYFETAAASDAGAPAGRDSSEEEARARVKKIREEIAADSVAQEKKTPPGASGEIDRKSLSYKLCAIFFTVLAACAACLTLGYVGTFVGAMVGMYRDGRFNMGSILRESAVVGSYVGATIGAAAGFANVYWPGRNGGGAKLFSALFEAAAFGAIGYYLFWYLGEATGVMMVVYGHWRELMTGSYAYTGGNIGAIAGAAAGFYCGPAAGEYLYGKIFNKRG